MVEVVAAKGSEYRSPITLMNQVTTEQATLKSTSAPTSPQDRYFQTDHLMADLKGRSVRGGAITLVVQAVKFVLQMGSTMVLARLLIPADFGLIAMVAAFTGFVGLFKDLGLSMATIQRPEITHAQVSTLFWINVALSFAFALIAATLAPVVAWFYGEPALTWVTIAIAGTFIFGGLSAQHTALLRRQMRFKALATINVVAMAAGITVAITIAWATSSYWALVSGIAVQAATTTILSFAASGWIPGKPIREAGTQEMLRFGGGLTGFNVLNYFTRNADNVIIGVTLGSSALGIYAKAYDLLMMPIRRINSPLTGVMMPALCRLHNNPLRYRRFYVRALSAIATITTPIVTIMFVLAHDVVLVLLGDQWIEAVSVFRWLGPAAFAGSINIAPGWLCMSLGRSWIQVKWAMVSAPITVLAFLIGVNWGANGVAAAFSLSWCILLVVFIRWACHDSPVRFRDVVGALLYPAVACILAGSATAFVIILLLSEALPFVRLVIGFVFFISIYVAILYSTGTGRDLIAAWPSLLNKRSPQTEATA